MDDKAYNHLDDGPQVRELHIDFLLEEEFCSNPEFLCAFLGIAKPALGSQLPEPLGEVQSVMRSVPDPYGEADLVVIYLNSAGSRIALLIEDKLRARFQPEQAMRYTKRGRAGIGNRWDSFRTCLVAPKAYARNPNGFDMKVNIEDIVGLFAGGEDLRHKFKVQVLQDAIRKCEANGVQVVDPVMTIFRERHFACFYEFFREEAQNGTFQIRLPAPTYSGDTWFEVRSPKLPRGTYINHKSAMGAVDLTFPNTDVAALEPLRPFLETGMAPVQTGKSAAIRLQVSAIRDFGDFDGVRTNVEEGLAAVRLLLGFYIQEKERFSAAMAQPAAIVSAGVP